MSPQFPLAYSTDEELAMASNVPLPSTPQGIRQGPSQQQPLAPQPAVGGNNSMVDTDERDHEQRPQHGELPGNSSNDADDGTAAVDNFLMFHLSMDSERQGGQPLSGPLPVQGAPTGLQHAHADQDRGEQWTLPFGHPAAAHQSLNSSFPQLQSGNAEAALSPHGTRLNVEDNPLNRSQREVQLPTTPLRQITRMEDLLNSSVNAPRRVRNRAPFLPESPCLGRDRGLGAIVVDALNPSHLGRSQRQPQSGFGNSTSMNLIGLGGFPDLNAPVFPVNNGGNIGFGNGTSTNSTGMGGFGNLNAPPFPVHNSGSIGFGGRQTPKPFVYTATDLSDPFLARPTGLNLPNQHRVDRPVPGELDPAIPHATNNISAGLPARIGVLPPPRFRFPPPTEPRLTAEMAETRAELMDRLPTLPQTLSRVQSSPHLDMDAPMSRYSDEIADDEGESASDWESDLKSNKRQRPNPKKANTSKNSSSSHKSTPSSGSTSSGRKVRAPRGRLFQWRSEDWQQIVLAFVRTFHNQGIRIPFDQVAHEFNQDCSASALRQAIAKLNAKLIAQGLPLPDLHMNWTDIPTGHRRSRSRGTQADMQKLRVSRRNLQTLARRTEDTNRPANLPNNIPHRDSAEGPSSTRFKAETEDDGSNTLRFSTRNAPRAGTVQSNLPIPRTVMPAPHQYRPSAPSYLPPWDGSEHWPGSATMRQHPSAGDRFTVQPSPYLTDDPPLYDPYNDVYLGNGVWIPNPTLDAGTFPAPGTGAHGNSAQPSLRRTGPFYDRVAPSTGSPSQQTAPSVNTFGGFGGNMAGNTAGSGGLAPPQNLGQEQEEEEKAAEGDAFPFGNADPSRHAF